MFKLAGVLCILTGCIGWGGNRIMEEKDRVRHLREMIRIIKRIQDEISYGKHTLPEVCLLLSENCDIAYRPFLKRIYEQMNRGDNACFDRIWEQQMYDCLRDIPLSEDEKDILRKLPQNLGMQEEKLQAESIGQSMDLLMRTCRRTEDAYENKSRMIFSVSVLAGVFLIILLL